MPTAPVPRPGSMHLNLVNPSSKFKNSERENPNSQSLWIHKQRNFSSNPTCNGWLWWHQQQPNFATEEERCEFPPNRWIAVLTTPDSRIQSVRTHTARRRTYHAVPGLLLVVGEKLVVEDEVAHVEEGPPDLPPPVPHQPPLVPHRGRGGRRPRPRGRALGQLPAPRHPRRRRPRELAAPRGVPPRHRRAQHHPHHVVPPTQVAVAPLDSGVVKRPYPGGEAAGSGSGTPPWMASEPGIAVALRVGRSPARRGGGGGRRVPRRVEAGRGEEAREFLRRTWIIIGEVKLLLDH
jgi:hypothetical protein